MTGTEFVESGTEGVGEEAEDEEGVDTGAGTKIFVVTT